VDGRFVPHDLSGGLSLIQKAASKNYGPALYVMGKREFEGQDVPQDRVKALDSMKKAAQYGSSDAQVDLGNRYDTGGGVEINKSQALHYFRLCAAGGTAQCQFRAGKLLLAEGHGEALEQAVAWLQLAGENGISEASDLARVEIDQLTPAQITKIKRLEAAFARK